MTFDMLEVKSYISSLPLSMPSVCAFLLLLETSVGGNCVRKPRACAAVAHSARYFTGQPAAASTLFLLGGGMACLTPKPKPTLAG